MSKKCPNCGRELEDNLTVCSHCGYQLEKMSENSDVEEYSNSEKEETTAFLNKKVNENIEWSELKDMSLGHVMNMFNEQPETKEEKMVIADDKIKITNDSEFTEVTSEGSVEQLAEVEVTKLTETDLDVGANGSKTGSPLIEYIKEHKNLDTEIEELVDETFIEPDISEDMSKEDEVIPVDQDIEPEAIEPEHTAEMIEEATAKIIEEVETEEQQVIPSKSKKPEEIEMDAAPIFFKEADEEPKEFSSKASETAGTLTKRSNEASPSRKNSKKQYIVAASVVILATGGWFVYDQVQKNAASEKKIQTEQLAEAKELATTTKETLENYFTDDSHVFIKPGMIGVSTASIQKDLDKLKKQSDYKEMKTLYDLLAMKQAEISKVNKLFAQPVINGTQLNDVAIIADKKVEVKKVEVKDALDKLVNQAIDEATQQYDQLQKAKELVTVIYTDNKTTDQLTQTNYELAKTEVDKVKSATLRKPLTDALDSANKALAAAQDEVAAASSTVNQTVAEENATSQTSTAGTPNTSSFTAPNSNGIYTEPVYTVIPSDVADINNPAWSWAPGIKERVIATCIERGYIVDGGYVLEPVRIINGEGYYNLYGTNNQSKLLSGFSEKDFPVYLVTINDKTGWFKGNASRNAGN